MASFRGITVALVTPMNAEKQVDVAQLEQLIEFEIQKGVHALLLLGGTGEYTSMSFEERCKTVTAGVAAVAGRVPVMVGVLDPGWNDCLRFCRYAKAAGADALLVLPPYYYVGTQDALAAYYKTLDKEVDMPIFIYNIPYRTNVNVLPDTVLRLSKEMKNLAGIKECASLSQAMSLLIKVGDQIEVLTGDEFAAVSLMSMGAAGAIMATANVVPEAWVTMYALIQNGQIKEALAMSLDYYPLFQAFFSENYIGPLKYAMGKRGLPCSLEQILPLIPPQEKTEELVDAQMTRLGYYD